MDSDTSPSQPSPPASLDAEVAAFLSAPTPRSDIPPKIVKAGYAQVTPGVGFFAAALLILGGVFFLVMVISRPAVWHDQELSRKHSIAQGVVLSADPVTVHVGGKHPYDYTVFRFFFVFRPATTSAGGEQAPGIMPLRGVCYADTQLWQAAQPVTVEYNPDNAVMARIQGARIFPERNAFAGALAALIFGLLWLAAGIFVARRVFKKRAFARWLMENGTVGEFRIVDMNIISRNNKLPDIYVFQLNLVDKTSDDTRSYFAQFTKRYQSKSVEALWHAQMPSFGLYDPNSTGKKRLVLMVEAWFH